VGATQTVAELKPSEGAMSKRPTSAEIHPGPGFRVKTRIPRPAPEIVERFRAYPTPDISDLMNRLYAMDGGIRNLVNDLGLCGPALPVKLYPGDNLMLHKALDVARPGDVVVVDSSLNTTTAVIGDLVSSKAKHRGIQGVIVDGLVRDVAAVREVGLPIYARGTTPIGPLHRGPGELGYPVSCGGLVVSPGDIIVADSSGIVVVRLDFAEELLDRLDAQRPALSAYVANVKKGVFSNEWVDRYLEQNACQITD
jgi:regulator of RNase E activity RraA